MVTGGVSERRALTVVRMSAAALRYVPRPDPDPGLRDRILTEQGQVREHVNIFIGDEDVRYTGGLTSRISASSDISIVPAISGG